MNFWFLILFLIWLALLVWIDDFQVQEKNLHSTANRMITKKVSKMYVGCYFLLRTFLSSSFSELLALFAQIETSQEKIQNMILGNFLTWSLVLKYVRFHLPESVGYNSVSNLGLNRYKWVLYEAKQL